MKLNKFKILNKEKNLIEDNDKIIIAMSGGPDSIFLYELLKKLKEKMNLTLYFAHINHNLRGEDSDSDENFVKLLGENEKVPTYIKNIDIKKYAKDNKLSDEEAGREVRYNFFRKLKEELGGTKVALAHNEDDIVETFMFRLIRGTSLKGLEGIPIKREFFIRPIIRYKKEEILNYLDSNNIKYCIDKTNFKEDYTRNKIRLNLIPKIENEYNKKFKEKIVNLISDIAAFNGIINSNLKKYIKNDTLNINELKKEDEFFQRVVLSEYLQKYNISVNRNKINEVQKLLYTEGTKEISGNSRCRIKKTYDILEVTQAHNVQKGKIQVSFKVPGSINWNRYRIEAQISDKDENKSKDVFFCNLKSGDTITVRSRENGDKFYPVGLKGSKKIKDFFIDLKIPKEERDEIPILTYDDDIIWVAGIRGDRRFIKEEKEKKYVRLSIEKI